MTTRLAAAVEYSSGSGDACGPHLEKSVTQALSERELVARAGQAPDASPSGNPPRPLRGVGARRDHNVQAGSSGGLLAWAQTSVEARGPRRATLSGPAAALPSAGPGATWGDA